MVGEFRAQGFWRYTALSLGFLGMVELRDYQYDLLQRVLQTLEADDSARVMMQLPTGGGKTVIAGELLRQWFTKGHRAVWLTHRTELVDQTEKMLNRSGVRTETDRCWSQGEEALARRGAAVILMAQTTGRRAAQGKIWGGYDAGDLMVVDEAHHAPADGYVLAMEQWPGRVVGMTATPWRLSMHEGFDHLFSNLVCGPQVAELQAEGALCAAQVIVPPLEQRIRSGEPGELGDFTEQGIERANHGPRRVMTAEAVRIWKQYAVDRPTIVYAVSVRHADNLQRFFEGAGVRADCIHNEVSREQRNAAIEGFKRGSVRVLINVLVATEGFDLPDASCVMMARPTLSLALYLQMIGRGLRPKSDGGDCLILDLAGNTLIHGLPDADRIWSLEPRDKQAADGVPIADDEFFERGGKSCGRCGKLRGWKWWEYETHCGDIHDLVCDLCHIDAHIEAHLPAAPPLDALVQSERQSIALTRVSDHAALVAFYNAASGPNWVRNDNWLTDAPLDEWYAVTVDDKSRVSGLNLASNNLQGKVPLELVNLINLTELDLGRNQFSGEIPKELGELANLSFLSLGENQLSGEIPRELSRLTNLSRLYLGGNQLSGDIPWELGRLTNLTELDLDRNQLSGEIPEELGELANLRVLSLGGNQLSGEIPKELGELANLSFLGLERNELSGEIPEELGELANLTHLYLRENQLSGEMPEELGELANLSVLDFGLNNLQGKVPLELVNLANLTVLNFGGNQLSGEIPWELSRLANLRVLDFGGNQLSGEIPWELSRLANLAGLGLEGNQLSGEIPKELGELANLSFLSLGENQLSGEIPRELSRLTNLSRLYLRGNQLSGEIPKGLGELANLTYLYLHENQISGEIPKGLGELANLTYLNFGGNQLSGDIPWELGRLTNLTELDLGGNQLSGDIPWELGRLTNLTQLGLDRNQLSGEIPKELGRLTNLTVLNLGANQLSGDIPAQLGQLSNLAIIRLSGNGQFTGCIPAGLRFVEENDLSDLGLPFC